MTQFKLTRPAAKAAATKSSLIFDSRRCPGSVIVRDAASYDMLVFIFKEHSGINAGLNHSTYVGTVNKDRADQATAINAIPRGTYQSVKQAIIKILDTKGA